MKKKLLFVVVTVLALASCSSDETIAVKQDSPINFRAYTTGLTRAADASLANGTSFKVTAFETGGVSTSFFEDVEFTATTGTTFTSTHKYYWPAATKKLDFYAWAPASYTATNHYSGFEITPGTTIGSQPDFIYAVSKGWNKDGSNSGQNGGSGVTLNFRHAESKIIINLKNTNNNLKITVDKVRIGNLRGTETFTWNQCTDGAATPATVDNTDVQDAKYLDGNWTDNSAQTSSYEVEVDASASYNVFDGLVATARGLKATASDYEMILIPQELSALTQYDATAHDFKGAFISVDLKIENKAEPGAYLAGSSSDFITAMWPLASITWLPGHKYTYIVDLAGGGYYPTDQTSPTPDNVLDPIIDSGAEIKFLNPTIDTWITDLDGNSVADDDINVTM